MNLRVYSLVLVFLFRPNFRSLCFMHARPDKLKIEMSDPQAEHLDRVTQWAARWLDHRGESPSPALPHELPPSFLQTRAHAIRTIVKMCEC